MVNAVADGDDLMEALNLNTEDLGKEKQQRACANKFLLVYRRRKDAAEDRKLISYKDCSFRGKNFNSFN